MSQFSEILKKLRLKNGLTQSQLSDSLGLNAKQTISDYENEKSQPNIEMLIKISEFFNVSTDFLLGKTNIERNHIIEKPITLFDFFKEAPSEEDKDFEKGIAKIINKFYDVINYCTKYERFNALSKIDKILSEMINFINSQGDSDTRNFLKVIKFIKSDTNRIPLDSAFKLKFKHKNIDSCIDELNSFFIAMLCDSISKYDIEEEE